MGWVSKREDQIERSDRAEPISPTAPSKIFIDQMPPRFAQNKPPQLSQEEIDAEIVRVLSTLESSWRRLDDAGSHLRRSSFKSNAKEMRNFFRAFRSRNADVHAVLKFLAPLVREMSNNANKRRWLSAMKHLESMLR
jgi:hypothetical protein